MLKIAYTVCSANHLAYAKAMADSFIKHNEDYKVFICLTDRVNQRFSTNQFLPHTIVEVENIGIEDFKKMNEQYSIIEFNCAVKPFMAKYILQQCDTDYLIYIDSDIYFYQSIKEVEIALEINPLLLTPHIFTPYNDDADPKERDTLRSGIYNAGFIAMRKSSTVTLFLEWWSNRLKDQCYYNFAEGMGVDQNWLNLVPLFFKETGILNSKGLNVAYWNLHERELTLINNQVYINHKEPLVFFHFSGYKFEKPELLSIHQNRINLAENALLKQILAQYKETVLRNGYDNFIKLKCHFAKHPKKKTGIMATLNKIISILGIKIIKNN